MSAVKTPAKLPSLTQRRRHSTEATTQHQYPFSDLDAEDGIMDQLSLAGTPTATVQRNTTTSKLQRSRRVSFSDRTSIITAPAQRVSFAEHASIVTTPARGAPLASPPATFVAVTDANFKPHHPSHGECLAHPSGCCDCEIVQLPTMSQNAAWKVMAQRFKAVHDNDFKVVHDNVACWNQRHALLAPPSTSSAGANEHAASRGARQPAAHELQRLSLPSTGANEPPQRSTGCHLSAAAARPKTVQRSVPTPHRASSAETPSTMQPCETARVVKGHIAAPLPRRPSAPPPPTANEPLQRRQRSVPSARSLASPASVPIPHRASSAETPSPTAPLPRRPSAPLPPLSHRRAQAIPRALR